MLPNDSNPHRLPRSIAPTAYRLSLSPDLQAATFAGTVSIDVDVLEATDVLVLNAIELEVLNAQVHQKGVVHEGAIALDEELERLTLTLDTPLAVGAARVEITFNGILNDKLRGFYRSTYTDDDGTEQTIATTQFESTNARRCFPCWDEPDRKATFAVSLDIPDDLLAVSAQPEIGRTPTSDGRVRVDFAPTPLMSTYLLAFVVGRLEASAPIDVDGIPVRIIHRPGRGDEVVFAHAATAFCLRWLTDYFDVPYFGDKIDMLAIPDFAFGAMENTGCITFREVLLLVDPEATTQPEQQRSVAVIAHELAHMWFGNLVTMQWWEGLWLKEAFATFMETSATHAYRPDWRVWEGFALDRSAAYEVDALHATRPIEYEVHSPADAEGMYDVLTYEKGASVVRMLEQYVGPDAFREGMRGYMRAHAFGNTVTSDLWAAIERATRLPVAEIMHEWIHQGGFPMLSASLDTSDSVPLMSIEQAPFKLLDSPIDGDAATPTAEWQIPVSVEADGSRTTVLMTPSGRVRLDDANAQIIVDPGRDGFFRVRYDRELLNRLTPRLDSLTAAQRYGLFDDLFAAVLAGQSDVADYVAAASAVRNETSPPVWSTLSGGFATLAHVAVDRPARAAVGDAWAAVAGPELAAIGIDRPEDEADPLLNEVRASLFSSLGSLSALPDVIERARAIVAADMGENPSLESAAVRVVASHGDRADYDEFLHRFETANSPQLERRYLFALARFDDADAIEDLCARSVDGSIRSQDAAFVLGAALSNRWHGPQVWSFITGSWDQIAATVPDNAIGRMLGGVQWLEHADLDAVDDFLKANDIAQARQAIRQHRERLRVHAALRNRLAASMAAELSSGLNPSV